MNKVNLALGIAVVALVITLYSSLTLSHNSEGLVGSTSCSGITCLAGGLRLVTGLGGNFESDIAAIFSGGTKIGTNGTNLTQVLGGTCSLIAPSFTVAASSTVPMDCAISNVVSTDVAFAQFATSTATSFGGWSVRGASASTTAGFITVSVVNGTGGSAIIPASIASSTKYIVLR